MGTVLSNLTTTTPCCENVQQTPDVGSEIYKGTIEGMVKGTYESVVQILSTPTTREQVGALMRGHLGVLSPSRLRDVSAAVWATVIAMARAFGARP